MSGFREAYRRSVARCGVFKTWMLIATSPVRMAWLYLGMALHAVGAAMMGDYHG